MRPRTDDSSVGLALLNWWADAEAHKRWADVAARVDLLQAVRIIRSTESSAFERDDELCLAGGHVLNRFHQVLPCRSADYRAARRDVANPSMAERTGSSASRWELTRTGRAAS